MIDVRQTGSTPSDAGRPGPGRVEDKARFALAADAAVKGSQTCHTANAATPLALSGQTVERRESRIEDAGNRRSLS